MEQPMMREKLGELRKLSVARSGRLKKEALCIAIFRGFLFLAAAYWLWWLFPSVFIFIYGFFILLLFLWMMKLQADKRKKLGFETAFQQVISRDLEEQKIQDTFKIPEELEHHPLSTDLDVFGHFSLHSAIHRSYSSASAIKLGKSLIDYPQDPATILGFQKELLALREKVEEVYRFFTLSLLASFSEKEERGLHDWLNSAHFKVNIWLIRGFTFLFLLVAIGVGMEVIPPQLLMYTFIVNLMLVYSRNKKIAALQVNLSRVHPSLEQVATQMGHWQETLSEEDEKSIWEEPRLALKSLSRIMARLDSRLNPLGAFISNGVFLYDLTTMYQLEQWRAKYATQLPGWMDELAKREVLASKGAYYMRQGGVFPGLGEGAFELQFKELIHPLMKREKAVGNSFSMTDKAQGIVLTGSNMSGKSTFLRTIGSSLILAHNGLPLPCLSFTFTPLQLYSAIRVNDSLEEDASYFYAELKRLASITKHAGTQPRVFILLDEILRGTNSADKQAGSRALLLQLIIHKKANAILATHDLSLTELASEYPDQIANYAFESRIIDNKLSFDFTLKKGVCSQLNAMFLMKTMGIME
ncbi:MAG: MutS-related protein [Bacteroidia bacterium]